MSQPDPLTPDPLTPDPLTIVSAWLAGTEPLLDLHTDVDPWPIQSFLQQAGLDAIYLDLNQATDKASLLAALHQQLGLGDWFGFNWDALEEALFTLEVQRELDGAASMDQVLMCHGTLPLRTHAPKDAAVFIEILQNIATDPGSRLRGCILSP